MRSTRHVGCDFDSRALTGRRSQTRGCSAKFALLTRRPRRAWVAVRQADRVRTTVMSGSPNKPWGGLGDGAGAWTIPQEAPVAMSPILRPLPGAQQRRPPGMSFCGWPPWQGPNLRAAGIVSGRLLGWPQSATGPRIDHWRVQNTQDPREEKGEPGLMAGVLTGLARRRPAVFTLQLQPLYASRRSGVERIDSRPSHVSAFCRARDREGVERSSSLPGCSSGHKYAPSTRPVVSSHPSFHPELQLVIEKPSNPITDSR